MSHIRPSSPPDLLPLAAGLGATAALAFTLGALTATWWLSPTAPARQAAATQAAPGPAQVTMAVPKAGPPPAHIPAMTPPARVKMAAPLVTAPAKPVIEPLVLAAADSLSLPSPARGGFAVQLGAFLEPGNARSFQQTLAARGLTARVVPWTDRHGRVWFTTRMDSYGDEADAQTAATTLAQQGFHTLVVRDDAGEES